MTRRPRASFRPEALDVAAFCRDAARLDGEWPLSALPRLASSVQTGADGFASAAPVRFGVVGLVERGRFAQRDLRARVLAPQPVLELEVQAHVGLECQRCLQPLTVPLHVQRRIRFVEGEDVAARLDEESEDDVLALEARLDLRTLVEDELLLALPLVPRHERCPQLPAALTFSAAEEPVPRAATSGSPGDERPPDRQAGGPTQRPFAVLARLKAAQPSTEASPQPAKGGPKADERG